MIIILPITATFIEWLKSWFLTGFTWLSPADTLVNFGFSTLLPVTGTLGVSYVFYLLIALLLYVCIKRTLYALFSLLIFIFTLLLLFYTLQDKSYTVPMDKNVYTQIIQAHFTKKDKSKRYKVIKRIKRFQALALQEPRAELSVWPESSMSIEYKVLKKNLKNGFNELREKEVEVFYGGYDKSQNVLMQNSMKKVAYSKQHLMPFGEYTPTWLLKIKSLLPNFENSDLKSVGNVNNIKIDTVLYAPSICYELLFPEELRKLTAQANVLVHISDLGWFDHSWAQSYLLNLARMRSMEHQKPMIYVVNSGNSAFILANGQIQELSTSITGAQALYAHITPHTGMTVYAKYGERPVLYALVFLLGIY